VSPPDILSRAHLPCPVDPSNKDIKISLCLPESMLALPHQADRGRPAKLFQPGQHEAALRGQCQPLLLDLLETLFQPDSENVEVVRGMVHRPQHCGNVPHTQTGPPANDDETQPDCFIRPIACPPRAMARRRHQFLFVIEAQGALAHAQALSQVARCDVEGQCVKGQIRELAGWQDKGGLRKQDSSAPRGVAAGVSGSRLSWECCRIGCDEKHVTQVRDITNRKGFRLRPWCYAAMKPDPTARKTAEVRSVTLSLR
jgi:hypothetical protein